MRTHPAPSALVSLLSLLSSLLCACAGDTSGSGSSAGDDATGPELVTTGDDAAGVDAITSAGWPVVAVSDAGPAPTADATLPLAWDSGSTPDAPASMPEASCVQPLGAGVLAIDELMIESVKGTGDYGEWLEVQSTSRCAVNLNGLHGECPVGMKLHTFDVTQDMWLPPSGTFVIADTADPAVDHYLPGLLVTWAGQPGDVLRNEGGTVTLTVDGNLVDTVTYPAFKLVIGTSVAFPSNCPMSSRSDWTSWQMSSASWFPGFDGTPMTTSAALDGLSPRRPGARCDGATRPAARTRSARRWRAAPSAPA
jgi:hypothetical protein